jgi:hypothetical protein
MWSLLMKRLKHWKPLVLVYQSVTVLYIFAYLSGLLDSDFQSQKVDPSWGSDATSSYDTFP